MLTRAHIIKKLVLDVRFPSQDAQAGYYQQLKGICYDQILPRLEKIANEYCDAYAVTSVGTIELDTGGILLSDIENEFPERVEQKFREVLKQALSKTNNVDDKGLQVVPPANSTFEILEYFLKTGDLPWFINNRQTVNIDELLLEAHKTSADKLQLLLRELTIVAEVSVRIQSQFNADSMKLIRQILSSPIFSVEYYLITGSRPWWISNKEAFAISNLLSEIKKEHSSELRHLLFELSENPDISANIKNRVNNEAVDIINAITENPLFVLEYFLMTGELPSFIKDKSSLDADRLVEKLYTQERKELAKLLIAVLQNSNVALRIQNQFSAESVQLMVQLLKASLPLKHHDLINDLGTACESFTLINISSPVFNQLALPVLAETLSKKEPLETFALRIIKSLAKFRKKPLTTVYAELLYSLSGIYPLILNQNRLKELVENFRTKTPEINLLITSATPAFSQIENFTNVLIKGYQTTKVNTGYDKSQFNDSKETNYSVEIVGVQENGDAEKVNIIGDERAMQDYPDNKQVTPDDAVNWKLTNLPSLKDINTTVQKIEESYIDNAGMVILWPYLQLFFEHLKYVKKGKFVSEKLQKRAILMLHYLVWDEEKAPEYRLFLNKFFCGYNTAKPVELLVRFTLEEKKEAAELLGAVVKNWPVLKNTSAAGLRDTFLQRNGIVRKRDKYWTLQVEKKTFDILMESLPWSLSVIKLPWMNEILYVEW